MVVQGYPRKPIKYLRNVGHESSLRHALIMRGDISYCQTEVILVRIPFNSQGLGVLCFGIRDGMYGLGVPKQRINVLEYCRLTGLPLP